MQIPASLRSDFIHIASEQSIHIAGIRNRATDPAGAIPRMSRIRIPVVHPLKDAFFTAVQSVTSALSASSQGRYRTTVESFLRYLGQHQAGVEALDQLRRDHFLGWFSWLSSQQPRLVKSTRCLHIVTLRRVMEELAWLHEMPPWRACFIPTTFPVSITASRGLCFPSRIVSFKKSSCAAT